MFHVTYYDMMLYDNIIRLHIILYDHTEQHHLIFK